MSKYEVTIQETCIRTTTIVVEADSFEDAYNKSCTSSYGENDFSVSYVNSVPVEFKLVE